MYKKLLKAIKEVYESGGNIIQFLKKNENDLNTPEMILVSYDFQSGAYIRGVKKNLHYNDKYTAAVAQTIVGLGARFDSLLEAGVGEATTLANVVQKLPKRPKQIFGFDISWSRVRYAFEYLKKKHIRNSLVFVGDLFNIPLANNSIDIVYTSHSIEPNCGKEKEALQELMRITKKYLILLEPAYEFADTDARKRMEAHGYITNLYDSAMELGLNVVEHRLFDVSRNPMNPTGLIIIKKEPIVHKLVRNQLVCPLTKAPLRLINGSYFSKDSLLVYPVIDKVPCLLVENSVIGTHFGEKFLI